MALTQIVFAALDANAPVIDARNAVSESVVPTGTSAATTAVADKDSTVCRVATDTAVYVSFGTAPNATSDTLKFYVPAGTVEHFRVKYLQKAAVVTA